MHAMRKLTLEALDSDAFVGLSGSPEFEALVEEVRANPP
jgi:hypothetical protein